ncbi:glutamate--tRNA ligase [Polynucleobacter sp. TUM22923]|jgi:glutamyl-tRNA synthetase|uniref:glutamate--tRNA ligase n=1 Tax=Polynucleobacter sp. TUM22923 TaxID=3022126 RepID=UPI0025734109|nr:glutamate--tRNA ligase [Polynucleobacter sp. TUM22923]BDX21510.1 glutamate--tRNA ligase [Polynucleobacter sp. TUM22923]
MHIRTRFAPSPTGFIHLGNLRSALYPWAFARHNQGDFILRIEDTDLERSSQEAVDVIIEGMAWLGLDLDEGPIYQMQRIDRYRAVVKQMLDSGLAYPCYMSEEELNQIRDQQMLDKEKPRYNGRWRPEPGKTLPAIPTDVMPVIRFKNPIGGSVIWDDAVKGKIEISNDELDDLVIARPDGTPTYNFCVVVDDLDMKITHVIRGDDHVNNTPRQINIMKALGGELPVYAHLPTVLNDSGEKMSKRNGAMSVRDYQKAGYLPEAILNYLARLGWSHGDAEVFAKEQFVQWFDLASLGRSPAQHNPEKLLWLNHQYIQNTDSKQLAELTKPFAHVLGIDTENGPDFVQVVGLLKDRANTLIEIAEGAKLFYLPAPTHTSDQIAANIAKDIVPALQDLIKAIEVIEPSKEAYGAVFKQVLAQHQIKMPALAMPVRFALFATTQTPAIDSVLVVLGKQEVLNRLSKVV